MKLARSLLFLDTVDLSAHYTHFFEKGLEFGFVNFVVARNNSDWLVVTSVRRNLATADTRTNIW